MHPDVNEAEDWQVETEDEMQKDRDEEEKLDVKTKKSWKTVLRKWKRKGRKNVENDQQNDQRNDLRNDLPVVIELPYGKGEIQDIILR
jgi:hypothetical protein